MSQPNGPPAWDAAWDHEEDDWDSTPDSDDGDNDPEDDDWDEDDWNEPLHEDDWLTDPYTPEE